MQFFTIYQNNSKQLSYTIEGSDIALRRLPQRYTFRSFCIHLSTVVLTERMAPILKLLGPKERGEYSDLPHYGLVHVQDYAM